MFKRYGHYFAIGVFLVDMLWLVCAWGLSYQLRFYWDLLSLFAPVQAPADVQPYLRATLPLVVICGAFFINRGFYRTSRLWTLGEEIEHVIKGSILAFAFFVAFLYATSPHGQSVLINRTFLAVFLVALAAGLVVLRVLQRILLDSVRSSGYYTRRTLLIGDGEGAASACRHLRDNPACGLDFLGMLNGDGASGPGDLPEVLGSYGDLDRVVKEKTIDQVVLALPGRDYDHLGPIIERLISEFIDVSVVPDLLQQKHLRCANTTVDGIPMVCLNEPRFNSRAIVIKRIMDFSLSLVAIAVFGPLMLVVALAIKLTSRGPVLYVQERMGLDGRRFPMLKFRTMPLGSEDATGPVWADEGDERPTRLGRFLRRTSLDEFPQLFNTLVGDMSLVGPRPERPFFVEEFRNKFPGYVLRHKIKGGITGWAQINGWRGNTSPEKRLEHDLYYIENWSVLLDLKILLLTLRYGFVNSHAY